MTRDQTIPERNAAARARRDRILPWLLVIVGAAVYANALRGPFIYDDFKAIVENPQVRQLWPPWSPPQTPTAGRPIPALTFAINYATGGLDVVGYHVVNVAIHLANTLLLFGLLRRTFRGPRLAERFGGAAGGLAFAGALLWMTHPLATESVNYITQRTGTLMSLFYLATLYAALRAHASRAWGCAAIVCALGMASKESMVTAPLVVVLFDHTLWRRRDEGVGRARWTLYGGLAATWIVLVALNLAGPRSATVGFAVGVSATEYFFNQCMILVDYLRLVVWPHPLVLDYGYPRPIGLGDVWPQALFLSGLGLGAIVGLVRRSPVGFALAFFFIVLAPTSSFVPIASEVGAERRMYLPLAALLALGVAGSYCVLGRIGRGGAWVRPALTLAVAAGLALGTVRRNSDYDSELAIWASAVAAAPRNPRAHNNFGNLLEEAGRLDEAIAHHRQSVALGAEVTAGPRHRARAHFNLGRVLQIRGAVDDAIVQYQEAVRHAPHARAHHNLGTLLHGAGRTSEAIAHLEQAVELAPDSVDALTNLGFARLQGGDIVGAVPPLQQALALTPDLPRVQFNLAGALRTLGRREAAAAHYRAAGALTSDDAEMQALVGFALDDLGHHGEAVDSLDRAVALNPDHAGAFERLGGALVRSGRPDEGIVYLRRAIQRWPDRTSAWIDATRVLAEHPVPERRDATEAVILGQEVVSMTGGRDPHAWSALAAAHAANGRMPDATTAVKRALALAEAGTDVALIRELRGQLDRYRRR